MIPLGLSTAERRAFEAELVSPGQQLRVRVSMLRLGEDYLADLSSRLVDGQVNIDTGAETTRSLSLTLDDPNATLHLDSDAPGDGAMYVDRMIKVEYQVFTPAINDWVRVPVFTGPVTALTRDGSQVQITALGKEWLAKGQCWRPLTIGKGADVVNAIRTILRERAGETSFAFPTLPRRLPQAVSLGRMTQPWVVAQALARSLGRQLYYDGDGTCRLRSAPGQVVYTFRQGNGAVLSDPQVQYDVTNICNAVWVTGGKPKGAKNPLTATAVANGLHPLSPWRLGRNNVPRFLVNAVQNDAMATQATCNQLAHDVLAQVLLEGVTVTFDSLPIPHLDPLDVVRLSTDEASVAFRLNQASIPLVHDGTMSVGTVRRVTPRPRAFR